MITVSNLCKTYYSKNEEPVVAINQVNLSFADTGLVSIVGPSGCGKTTLLNILGGMDNASSGSVMYNGVDIETFSELDWDIYRSHNLGFVFQSCNLIDELSVQKNLELPLLLKSRDVITESNERVNSLAERFGMSELLSKKVKHLSGGQKQRVAILRAIVKNPRIVLADEPTGNLDRDNSRLVYELLKTISKSCLVVVVSHDRELSGEYSDRIIHLSYGEVIRDETKSAETGKINREAKETTKEITKEITKETKSASLPLSFCASFALESFKSRFIRFFIALSMMAISMTLILLFTICAFNNREGILTKYIREKNNNLYNVYLPVDTIYAGYLGNNSKQIKNGIELVELLDNGLGEEQIIFVNDYATVEYQDNLDEVVFLGTNTSSEILADYQLENNQVIVNRIYASSNNISEYNLPIMVKVDNVDVQIVGISDYEVGDKKQGVILGNKTLWLVLSQAYIEELKGIDIVGSGGANEIAESVVSFSSIDSLQGGIVVGHLPVNGNEVAVSENYILTRGRNAENILGQKFYTYNLREQKFGNSYYDIINLWDIVGEKMTVTGVVDGDYDYYFSENTYNAIVEKAGHYQGRVAFVCNKSQLKKTIFYSGKKWC